MARSEASLKHRWQACGQALDDVGLAMAGFRDLSVDVTGMSIRGPRHEGDEFLLVIRGLDEENRPVVAFNSAHHLDEAFISLQARLRNGSLKWRPDEFAK